MTVPYMQDLICVRNYFEHQTALVFNNPFPQKKCGISAAFIERLFGFPRIVSYWNERIHILNRDPREDVFIDLTGDQFSSLIPPVLVEKNVPYVLEPTEQPLHDVGLDLIVDRLSQNFFLRIP